MILNIHKKKRDNRFPISLASVIFVVVLVTACGITPNAKVHAAIPATTTLPTATASGPAPPSTPPTTKTCPDGSVIDASTNCPTQTTPPTIPNTPSTPPSTSGTPPPSNNLPPSSSNNGGGGSSSGSGGSGSGSGGGSGPTQPTTVS